MHQHLESYQPIQVIGRIQAYEVLLLEVHAEYLSNSVCFCSQHWAAPLQLQDPISAMLVLSLLVNMTN